MKNAKAFLSYFISIENQRHTNSAKNLLKMPHSSKEAVNRCQIANTQEDSFILSLCD
jgi:hypothetical protein